MAWDEWEQLKSAAAERHSVGMQLNHVPIDLADGKAPTSNGQGDLKVSQQHLTKIGDLAFDLYNRLQREGKVAEDSTDGAATDFSAQGFELGGALTHVSTRWDSSLNDLLDACAHISNHMDVTKNAHAGDEVFIERRVSSIDTLDAGFDERVGAPGKRNDIYGDHDKNKKKGGK
jgi:hypothetical protein